MPVENVVLLVPWSIHKCVAQAQGSPASGCSVVADFPLDSSPSLVAKIVLAWATVFSTVRLFIVNYVLFSGFFQRPSDVCAATVQLPQMRRQKLRLFTP